MQMTAANGKRSRYAAGACVGLVLCSIAPLQALKGISAPGAVCRDTSSTDRLGLGMEIFAETGETGDAVPVDKHNMTQKEREAEIRRELMWRLEGSFSCNTTVPTQRSDKMVYGRNAECDAELDARVGNNCGGEGCGLVLVGDSIFELIMGTMCYSKEGPIPQNFSSDRDRDAILPKKWRPLILARAGDQTHHTLFNLGHTLPLLKTPKVFFVMIGTNNVGGQGRFGAEDTAAGVKAVVSKLRQAHPGAKVLLHGILPRSDLPVQDTIDRANELIRQDVQPGVHYIDCGHVFPHKGDVVALDEQSEREAASALMPDWLHPGYLGYAAWFACLRPILEHAMSETAAF
eukprot:gnl/TRDRNA2_/TRDRNA2_187176_c0_seq1.p1 gnl/TRDRNA2_/TRDRNA2_187176_c0~~gnl/TRDRNA2_/TRDRNA2_187176_c0_seq1.p1  ORF type:complete len:346 (+),score=36.83 gnl/TRDRNA2_/TRDRNA2_187176_c0_seq1:45-1082(+)